MKTEGKNIEIAGATSAETWIIQPSGDGESKLVTAELAAAERLNPGRERCIVSLTVHDWNSELPPWEAEPVFGKQGFGNGAGKTLDYIENTLIPELKRGFPAERRKFFLCGYSLAGLFALWACHRTGCFAGVAAVSPSVWFPGWIEYAGTHTVKSGAVYLSLGDREEKTKNARLAAVGTDIRRQYEILRQAHIPCTLEWNAGNHFVNADERLAKGIVWLEKTLAPAAE